MSRQGWDAKFLNRPDGLAQGCSVRYELLSKTQRGGEIIHSPENGEMG